MELLKNITWGFEQVLEAAVWSLTSHLKKHPSKTSKTHRTLLDKQRQAYNWCSSMDLMHGCPSVGQPVRTCITSVWTLDIAWRTFQEWWMIGMDRQGNLCCQRNLKKSELLPIIFLFHFLNKKIFWFQHFFFY